MKTLELFARGARVYHWKHDQGYDHYSRQAVYKHLLNRYRPATVFRHAKQIAAILDRVEEEVKNEGGSHP